jgi:hypothetical protein
MRWRGDVRLAIIIDPDCKLGGALAGLFAPALRDLLGADASWLAA